MLLAERWIAGSSRAIELEDGTSAGLNGLLADARRRRAAEVRVVVARVIATLEQSTHILIAATGKSRAAAGRAPGGRGLGAAAMHETADFLGDLALGHVAGEPEARGPATVHALRRHALRKIAA